MFLGVYYISYYILESRKMKQPGYIFHLESNTFFFLTFSVGHIWTHRDSPGMHPPIHRRGGRTQKRQKAARAVKLNEIAEDDWLVKSRDPPKNMAKVKNPEIYDN